MLSSSHGAFLLLAIAYAATATHWSGWGTWQFFIWPFYLLLAMYVLATGYSFVHFKGTKLVHVLQIGQLPVAFLYWFIGTMAITHDSL
jgi:hypothetical protein